MAAPTGVAAAAARAAAAASLVKPCLCWRRCEQPLWLSWQQ
jgi:hypothetical protein